MQRSDRAMTDGATAAATSGRLVPFDYEAAVSTALWRSRLAWPLAPEAMRQAVAGPLHRLLAALPTLDPDSRARVLLAGHRFLGQARAALEAGLTVQAAAAQGHALYGRSPLLEFVQGKRDTDEGVRFVAPADARRERIRLAPLRRALRVRSWTPLWALPGALLRPQATAVTHNPLLVAEAHRRPERVSFCHASLILEATQRRSGTRQPSLDPGLVERMAALVVADTALDEPFRGRVTTLCRRLALRWLSAAARDLAALRESRDVPVEVWSGTGGNWASRAIGLEALRRGGRVVRFDHGGSAGMTTDDAQLVFGELAVSSRFVLPSRGLVGSVEAGEARSRLETWHSCALDGGRGDPSFRSVPRRASHRASVRPRVIYAPTLLRGLRQYHTGLLPDPVYLDWQLRLAEALLTLPLDLLCKPHPEGLLRGQRHPLAAVAPTSEALFETHIEEADVFVFDYAESTTFWKALCTSTPVVFIDLGTAEFSRTVLPRLQTRCTVLKAAFDAENRPQVDTEALAEAVLHGPASADPSAFRALLAGD